AVDHEVGDVEPVAGKAAMRGAAALGDFVLVVREDQIYTATVNVEVLAEVFQRHGAAFQVPAGTALAPRTRPEVGAILGLARLPEGEIGDRVLAVFIAVSGGGGGFQFSLV